MKITVDVADQLATLIREDLQWHILAMLKEGYDIHEKLERKAELFSSMCKVLEFYSSATEYKEFQKKLKGEKLG